MERSTGITLRHLKRLLGDLKLSPASQRLIMDLIVETSPLLDMPKLGPTIVMSAEEAVAPVAAPARRHRDIAAAFYAASTHREQLVGPGLIHDPVWLMMLESFIAAEDGRSITVEDLYRASAVGREPARRYVALMEQRGLLKRFGSTDRDGNDLVEPTDEAIMVVACIIDQAGSAA